jgi:hypothetical protein
VAVGVPIGNAHIGGSVARIAPDLVEVLRVVVVAKPG